MALRSNRFIEASGALIPNAYVGVHNISYIRNDNGWLCFVHMAVYFSAEARQENKSPLEVFTVQLDNEKAIGVPPFNAVYAHLKSLPEFADAVDV